MAVMAKRLFGSASASWMTAIFPIVAAFLGLRCSAPRPQTESRNSAAAISTSSFAAAFNTSAANETYQNEYANAQVSKLHGSLKLALRYADLDDFWSVALPDEASTLAGEVKRLLKQLYDSCLSTYLTTKTKTVDEDVIAPLLDRLGSKVEGLGLLPEDIVGKKMGRFIMTCLLPRGPCQDGPAPLSEQDLRDAVKEFQKLQPQGCANTVLWAGFTTAGKNATFEMRFKALRNSLPESAKVNLSQPEPCPAAESPEKIGEKLLAEASKLSHEELGDQLLNEVANLKSKLVQLGRADLADKLPQPPLNWGKLVGIVFPVAVAALACYMRVV